MEWHLNQEFFPGRPEAYSTARRFDGLASAAYTGIVQTFAGVTRSRAQP
jgi:hypothetical protein